MQGLFLKNAIDQEVSEISENIQNNRETQSPGDK
jgi:hypothetical protein